MQDTDRSQPPQAAAAPDDVRNYHASVVFGTIANALKSGWNHVALFRQSLRIGAAGRLAALDGNDGLVIADGAQSGFVFGDRVSGTQFGLWWRSGASLKLNSSDGGALWAIDPQTGVATMSQFPWQVVGTAVAFSNAWAAVAGLQTIRYRRTIMGDLQISGFMKSGTIGAAAFTLPAAYTPAVYHICTCEDGNNLAARIDVTTTGAVIQQTGVNSVTSVDITIPLT